MLLKNLYSRKTYIHANADEIVALLNKYALKVQSLNNF